MTTGRKRALRHKHRSGAQDLAGSSRPERDRAPGVAQAAPRPARAAAGGPRPSVRPIAARPSPPGAAIGQGRGFRRGPGLAAARGRERRLQRNPGARRCPRECLPLPPPPLPQPCPCLPGTEPGRTEPSRHQAAPLGAPLRAPSAPRCAPSPRGRLPCSAGVELSGGSVRGAEGPRLRPVSPGADGEARGVRWARGLAGGGCPVRAVPSAGCSRSVRPWCRLSLAGSGRQLCTDGYWPAELALLRPWCGARLERASLPADLYSRESAYL